MKYILIFLGLGIVVSIVTVVICYILYNEDLFRHFIHKGYKKAVKDIIKRKWFWDEFNQTYVNVECNVLDDDFNLDWIYRD